MQLPLPHTPLVLHEDTNLLESTYDSPSSNFDTILAQTAT